MQENKKAPIAAANQKGAGKIDKSNIGTFFGYCQCCTFWEFVRIIHNNRVVSEYPLCHFTGCRNPFWGIEGCHYIAGQWNSEASCYPLTAEEGEDRLDFLNCMRPGDCLTSSPIAGQKIADKTLSAIYQSAGICGKSDNHIGRAQRPQYREDVAASYRPGSVAALPFFKP